MTALARSKAGTVAEDVEDVVVVEVNIVDVDVAVVAVVDVVMASIADVDVEAAEAVVSEAVVAELRVDSPRRLCQNLCRRLKILSGLLCSHHWSLDL